MFPRKVTESTELSKIRGAIENFKTWLKKHKWIVNDKEFALAFGLDLDYRRYMKHCVCDDSYQYEAQDLQPATEEFLGLALVNYLLKNEEILKNRGATAVAVKNNGVECMRKQLLDSVTNILQETKVVKRSAIRNLFTSKTNEEKVTNDTPKKVEGKEIKAEKTEMYWRELYNNCDTPKIISFLELKDRGKENERYVCEVLVRTATNIDELIHLTCYDGVVANNKAMCAVAQYRGAKRISEGDACSIEFMIVVDLF